MSFSGPSSLNNKINDLAFLNIKNVSSLVKIVKCEVESSHVF